MSDAAALVDFRHCAAQSHAYQCIKPRNRVCNAWGRGVGKSWFLRVVMYLLVAEWDRQERVTLDGVLRGIRIVLLFPTLTQFKRIGMAQALVDDLSPGGRWGFLGATINCTDWRFTFPGGSWIQVVSAQDIDNNRGIRCDMLAADECDDIEIADYDSVCTPWFSQPWSLNIRLLSGTPRRGRYGLLWKAYRVWPKGDARNPPVPNFYGFHATYRDAPAIVSRDVVDEARRTMTAAAFAREWECDFDAAEGLVYPMFSAAFHVREPDYGVPWSEILVGCDYGTSDPGVYLVAGVIGTGRDAIVHLLEEVYETSRDTTWWCDKAVDIARRYRASRQRWFYDPSRPDRILDIRRAVREQVPEVGDRFTIEGGDNAIEAGVDAVADRLAIRENEAGERSCCLYVSARCRSTIDEFGLYRRKRDPQNQERVLDDILDKDNHAMDSTRYLVFTRFGGPDKKRHELPTGQGRPPALPA